MLGDAMFYGSGAGKLPTASAVVGDVVEAVKNIGYNLGYGWSEEKLQIQKQEEVEHRFFVRIKGKKEELQQKLEASSVSVTRLQRNDTSSAAISTPILSASNGDLPV